MFGIPGILPVTAFAKVNPFLLCFLTKYQVQQSAIEPEIHTNIIKRTIIPITLQTILSQLLFFTHYFLFLSNSQPDLQVYKMGGSSAIFASQIFLVVFHTYSPSHKEHTYSYVLLVINSLHWTHLARVHLTHY